MKPIIFSILSFRTVYDSIYSTSKITIIFIFITFKTTRKITPKNEEKIYVSFSMCQALNFQNILMVAVAHLGAASAGTSAAVGECGMAGTVRSTEQMGARNRQDPCTLLTYRGENPVLLGAAAVAQTWLQTPAFPSSQGPRKPFCLHRLGSSCFCSLASPHSWHLLPSGGKLWPSLGAVATQPVCMHSVQR